MTSEKKRDFKRYAYFTSKSKGFAVLIRSVKSKIVDGEKIVSDEGHRIEFRNGEYRCNLNDELGQTEYKFLKKFMEKEKDGDPRRRQVFMIEQPPEIITKETHNAEMAKKDQKIKELEDEKKERKEDNRQPQ